MKERGGGWRYREIFAGAETQEQRRQAIARAARALRQAMEREDNASVVAAHVENLADIPGAELAEAYAQAERNATFWPSPGQIRELAGWSDEGLAWKALLWVFEYLRAHGVDGRPRSGGVRYVEDATGRRAPETVAPCAPAPKIPADIAIALCAMGGGRMAPGADCAEKGATPGTESGAESGTPMTAALRDGLRCVAQHPAAQGWKTCSGDAAAAAERIERAWLRRHREARQTIRLHPLLRRGE